MEARHPDVKGVSARGGVLRVRLDESGGVDEVQVLDGEMASRLWTLRDGQHNSFPYHQLKWPLLHVDPTDERPEAVHSTRHDERVRWAALRALLDSSCFNENAATGWPGEGYLRRLRERQSQLASLDETDAAAVPALFHRFLRACEYPLTLLRGITDALVRDVQSGRTSSGLPLLTVALLDGGAPLYFDISEFDFDRDAGDPGNVTAISDALGGISAERSGGRCSITGRDEPLVEDKFPQPNLPILGQTYLFAKNRDAPTTARYGRIGTDGVAVGRDVAVRLQGAIEALTTEEWKDRTWRAIPGERPKQTDLFLAFVAAAPGAPIAAALSEDPEPDPEAADEFASLAQRLTEAFKGRILPRRDEELSLVVLRKLDPANRKVVYSATLTVGALLDSAWRWSTGCRNVPPGLQLPIPTGRGETPRSQAPREIAPLSLIAFMRRQFIRGGTEYQEVVGTTAVEAMRLFLSKDEAARIPARSLLHRVLQQREALLQGVAHARTRGFDSLKEFNRREALDTISVLGLLLHKLGRTREEYMEETAFKLGQLLAAADVLHAGYNASERGGSTLPPRLIGNAALPMAQADPARALAVLCRRWGVYHGWAKRRAQYRIPDKFVGKRRSDLASEQERRDFDRAWEIRRGISVSWRAAEIARELHGSLPKRGEVMERFQAELLLGYIAGLPHMDASGERDAGSMENPQQGE
ncbi:MAG TPA: hypothetical protein VHG28_07275 [Longimicrobiaceae bacterium]|nr:hypothetical protein [Longimicrobiaceae bacterium]